MAKFDFLKLLQTIKLRPTFIKEKRPFRESIRNGTIGFDGKKADCKIEGTVTFGAIDEKVVENGAMSSD